MIAVVVCIGNESTYKSVALTSIAKQSYDEIEVIELRRQTSIHDAYNSALQELRVQQCDAAVFMHEDVEFLQDNALHSITTSLTLDPDVAIIGPVGATNVRSLAWWEGTIHGRVSDPFVTIDTQDPFQEVDSLDGMLLGLSGWAIENLSFDSQYGGFHGYDAEICFQARAKSKKVKAANIPVFHKTKGGYGDSKAWQKAADYFQKKWIIEREPFAI